MVSCHARKGFHSFWSSCRSSCSRHKYAPYIRRFCNHCLDQQLRRRIFGKLKATAVKGSARFNLSVFSSSDEPLSSELELSAIIPLKAVGSYLPMILFTYVTEAERSLASPKRCRFCVWGYCGRPQRHWRHWRLRRGLQLWLLRKPAVPHSADRLFD